MSRARGWGAGARADAALALALCAVLVAASLPALDAPGSQFDEGFALAYPVRVLAGDVPHRDFVSFYGPGNPWLLAGVFALTGPSQDAGRAVGMLYRLLIVLAAAGAARAAAGRAAGIAAGALAIGALVPMGTWAYASTGALGCALGAIAALALAHARAGGAVARVAALAAGLLAGGALLARPDFFVALAPALAVLLWRGPRGTPAAFAGGLAGPALALAVHAAVVGPERIARVLSDARASGPGRRLPFDVAASDPGVAEPSRLLALAVVLALAALAAAPAARRARRAALAGRIVAALGLLSLALVPYALSRLDYVHVLAPLLPALVAAPAAAALIVAPGAAARAQGGARARAAALLAAACAAAAGALAPAELRAPVRAQLSMLLGRTPEPPRASVRVGARSFVLDPQLAREAQVIVDAAERERRAGARTLVVAPADLRLAYLNDAYMYFLLADLRPATYYMEFNPLTANRAGSGLAAELARADLLILNSAYDRPTEPNASRRRGPGAPNAVVRARFCPVAAAGTLSLLRRCRR